jgi:CBS domain-containing protein
VKHHPSNTSAGLPAVAPVPETAGEIMTTEIVSVPIGTSVRDVALLLLEKRISAVPVLAADGQLVGMVSEGDLLGRNDADRLARRDWWLAMLKDARSPLPKLLDTLVARPVEEVMRAPVMTIEARAPMHEAAEMLRVYDIKRLPVMLAGQMVGIVSRSDLVRAMASVIPRRASGRSAGGLLSLFAGMMQTDVRPEDASLSAIPSEPAVDRAAVTADAFRALVTASEQTDRNDAIAAKQQAKLNQQLRIKALLQEHLDEHAWAALLERALAAASQGEKSFELIRFPCDLCSDGSRKIDVAEADWPTTLRGEPAEVFARWERELRPAGFGLSGQIIEYFDGMPGTVALTLTWSPRHGAMSGG